MALYIPHSIFHLARLLYVRLETFGPYYVRKMQVALGRKQLQFFQIKYQFVRVNPLNAELNPIRHLLALVGARHIVHVSRIKVKDAYVCFLSV